MKRFIAFLQGIYEFRRGFTTGYLNSDGSTDWGCMYAHDVGRELAHIVTFRRFES